MSSEENRSSELETDLSLSKDREVIVGSSPSTPHKAWSIYCALKEKDKKRCVWMSANDEDTIRIDKFLHLYHLRRSKIPGY